MNMKCFMANEADILSDKIRRFPIGESEGVAPFYEAKRKRSFFRALKRKEPWALQKQAFYNLSNEIARQMYGFEEKK
jgi:hypothetical protein